ncbi:MULTISPECIES: hypothetical protein [Chryseobacterium]|uniref:HNH endonuclease n=1 Tax=Candidatus Chryseobacterium massiliense TaxID=204089 RepID=A0A3D9BAQ5_9FLAO|nr:MULTISPECIES: hypothetical protein [Chryseobacterium]REC50633.1 hypothetical protein DRF68_09055 [Candidatus Chryseobacterium massiliae]
MLKISSQSDRRYDNICCYCQTTILHNKTRDHIPSKVLLDEPFPNNLPIAFCCQQCNQGFSADEEYFACLLEYIVCEAKDSNLIQREKIRRILHKKPHLRKRIEKNISHENNIFTIKLEKKSINSILKKLFYGHLSFELSNPYIETPSYIGFDLIDNLTNSEFDTFFASEEIEIAPEIGTRASLNYFLRKNFPTSNWKIVQENNYQYKVNIYSEEIVVKILMRNKLCLTAIWNNKISDNH